MTSGYTSCACRDCMDTTVSSDARNPELCSECAATGCESWPGHDFWTSAAPAYDCQRDDAYDVGDAGTGHGSYEYHSGA